ncbi:hypothetical protein D3C85_15240 [compost metagenome]
MNVADLEGPSLRVMVAKALGYTYSVVRTEYGTGPRVLVEGHREYFRPDCDWAQGGRLIDNHWRDATAWLIDHLGPNWRDDVDGVPGSILVWFCRGIVGSVYGNVVGINNEGVVEEPHWPYADW